MEFNDPYVRIWHPVWASVEVDDPSLPLVREAVNITNYENVPTVVMTAPNSKGFIGLLSRCDLMIYPPSCVYEIYVKTALDTFFDVKEHVRMRYQQFLDEQSKKIHSRRPIGFNTNTDSNK